MLTTRFISGLISQESFDHVNDWLNEVNRYASEGTCKLLVGNKSDISENRVVSYESAKAFADSLAIPFLETSAKNAQNVEEAFLTMASELITIREMVGDSNRPKGATVRNSVFRALISVLSCLKSAAHGRRNASEWQLVWLQLQLASPLLCAAEQASHSYPTLPCRSDDLCNAFVLFSLLSCETVSIELDMYPDHKGILQAGVHHIVYWYQTGIIHFDSARQ